MCPHPKAQTVLTCFSPGNNRMFRINIRQNISLNMKKKKLFDINKVIQNDVSTTKQNYEEKGSRPQNKTPSPNRRIASVAYLQFFWKSGLARFAGLNVKMSVALTKRKAIKKNKKGFYKILMKCHIFFKTKEKRLFFARKHNICQESLTYSYTYEFSRSLPYMSKIFFCNNQNLSIVGDF